ncbi:hypothetical protein [Methyloceanibacter caenitepidi]|uniref:Phage-associated homing endonuclease n=1 Tax=Methyloceanibacter caenitepidi TaxID=1384459 RepID=A0A0A8K2E8_9HYPH|nr:hypothetical protein [Methyloceanibacter caenitepidi]BAQ16926.1 phage-associated homing endonuclease [Methyloceanibacter caenitepidi]
MTLSKSAGHSRGREAWAHLYKTKRWRQLRLAQLRRHPMCQCPHCKEKGLPAEVVDHIERHAGDRKLFFDRRNLQSMAKECHDRFKQSQERGGAGFDRGCDEHGLPLNPDHHWNAETSPTR